MPDNYEYSEVNQLRTRCTILESQIDVLQSKNAQLEERLAELEKTPKSRYKEIPNVGKFPVDYSALGPDDGSFQV
jgi:predicted  nucleic acid-binding Zn-ribbon protein